MKPCPQKTLSQLIRQKIEKRIVFCAMFLTLFLIVLTAYDLSKIVLNLSQELKKTTQELSELIISQSLMHNEKTLPFNIKQTRLIEGTHSTWLKNNNANEKGFVWRSFPSWKYVYPIKTLDNKKFGTIEINGNFSENNEFFREFLIRVVSFLFVIIVMSVLLLPLSNKIPHELFVVPVVYLLNILRQKNTDLSIDAEKNIGSEIREVIDNVVDLIEKEKKDATIETFYLVAQKVIHDIRSPLSVLDMTLLDIKQYVPEFEYSLLNEAIQSVRDTTNNSFSRYRKGIYIKNTKSSSKEKATTIDDIESNVSLALILETLVAQKRQEWRENPCNLIVSMDEIAQFFLIKAVPNNIKRILSNILNNSYEAIHEIREILIKLECQEEMLCIIIHDFGTGIPENKIEDVLSGVSLKHKGMGIGLSSAINYMKTINGNLKITSKLNEGTCVTLFFSIVT